MLAGWNSGSGARGVAVALVSTVVFFVLIGVVVTHAPGWSEFKQTFFDWDEFKRTMPDIARAFLLNVKIFCIAELLILGFALSTSRSASTRWSA